MFYETHAPGRLTPVGDFWGEVANIVGNAGAAVDNAADTKQEIERIWAGEDEQPSLPTLPTVQTTMPSEPREARDSTAVGSKSATAAARPPAEEGIWEKYKVWIIAGGALLVIAIIWIMMD